MAFQQPQKRPQPNRQLSYLTTGEAEASTAASNQRTSTKRSLAESEEWVLFSPTAPSATQTQTTSTDRTPRTAGLSHLSDFGSLETAAQSDQIFGESEENATDLATEADEEGELDSLDDGLHAFHEPSEYDSPRRAMQRSSETVLPTHDGLGTFGDDSAAVQAQFWQFERESSRRRHRRRQSGVQPTLEALEEEEELSEEGERMRRIEKWRLEQSRALLEEIERETRRMRKMSRVGTSRSQRADSVSMQTKSETNFSSGVVTPIVEEPVAAPAQPQESESFWQRVTRRVIRDLIGIDEELLSVILGEALLSDSRSSTDSTKTQADILKDSALETVESAPLLGESWEHRLLERVARDLGFLVNQLSEHPGAFSTYLKTQVTPGYAGLADSPAIAPGVTFEKASSSLHQSAASPTGGLFGPTIDPSLWGIEEEPEPEDMLARSTQQEREYWEREIDVKMVFNFLKNRFSSGTSSPTLDTTSALFTQSTGLTAQRAALIRQHHPLASRPSIGESSRRRHSQAQQQTLFRTRVLSGRTRSSSCASQSTKKSRKTGSSRNFWDIGGSVGSGPVGGIGVWGEVGI
ncbi:hypothetical protein EJ08DRAFT_222372 [Tothia fuscella]|uniref:Uncharacterized protein n=1 Tax=Tothia fuscella TaxID=1048955 RepID=A0A9P4P2E6_9PEZI|nr:hypothetical protein EJ08DRAFT_222372 [Tothia fuscella]